MTRYVALIGYPLGHSVSPPMQQAAFDYYQLDLRYQAWEAEPAQFGAIMERVRQPSTVGANITIPYKETVLPMMDELDELARQIGAVNTIVHREGKLSGYNTDAEGFVQALRHLGGFEPAGKRAVLIGAGGAARAVSFALARGGVRSLIITDIVEERAQVLSSSLTPLGVETSVLDPEDEDLQDALSNCDLVVNCTPVGMKHSATEGQSPLKAELIPREALIYDVVYNPIETQLLMDAKAIGARTIGGLGMLVYQGAKAFELWTGKEAPIDIMFEAAKRAL
ncbi:MAG: shikimate dehydrogenase [Chloroflexi bacterium]|nr:shikimate dehydrogenase [Chloroflexota bacterium]